MKHTLTIQTDASHPSGLRVLLDGHDISDFTSAVTVRWQSDEFTTAELTLNPDSVEIDGAALIHLIALASPPVATEENT